MEVESNGKRYYKDEDCTLVFNNEIANAPITDIEINAPRNSSYNQRHSQPRSSSDFFFEKVIADITKFPKKPWRDPGIDLSDYFNYSFDEYTWWQYSKILRDIKNYGACGDALYAPVQGYNEGIPNLLGFPSDRMLFDIDVNALDEKPWLIPRADLSDFFNYGHNPTTWNRWKNLMLQKVKKWKYYG